MTFNITLDDSLSVADDYLKTIMGPPTADPVTKVITQSPMYPNGLTDWLTAQIGGMVNGLMSSLPQKPEAVSVIEDQIKALEEQKRTLFSGTVSKR